MKLSLYEGEYERFEKDEGVIVKIMVPVLREDIGLTRCIIEAQSYHDVENDRNHYVLFSSREGDEESYSLDAVPIEFDENDIVFFEKVDGGDADGDLVKDLTPIFYSINSVLDTYAELQ